MISKITTHISYRSILLLLLFIIGFSLIAFAFQPLTMNFHDHFRGRSYVFLAGLVLGLLWIRVGRSLSFTLRYASIAFLYMLPLYLPYLMRPETARFPYVLEPTNAMVLSASLFAIVALIGLLPPPKNSWLRRLQSVIYGILSFFLVWFPLQFIGYTLVNPGLALSASSILTLFQTNPKEVIAFLSGQNTILWITGFIGILLVAIFSVWSGFKLRAKLRPYRAPSSIGCCILIILLLGLSGYLSVKAADYQPIRALEETNNTLDDYKEYRLETVRRQERLKELKGLSILPTAKGVYVLVIGESETRDHMGVYGYQRDTTPWLSSMAKENKALVFTHPYSNHTHTVPTLTYALSQKNQYNSIPLTDAYSLIEIANAAGYDTWWISNQSKIGAWDTPIAEVASTAKHQFWLNDNAGETIEATPYDSMTLNCLPNSVNDPALIVIHLMGCHGTYKDRYPAPDKYPTENLGKEEKRLNAYDNAVLYNDSILQKIYEKASRLPDFQGMVFMPDHGEDAATSHGHDAKYYKPVMSRIPFIVISSPLQQKERPDLYQTLLSHKDAYWTNDLLYDFMLSYLGITGAPDTDPSLDLSSPSYRLGPNDILTLHGARHPED